MTQRHWKGITFCREDAAREGRSPGLRRIAAISGVDLQELHRRFPRDPGNLAAHIAGIPKPTSAAGAQVPFRERGEKGKKE